METEAVVRAPTAAHGRPIGSRPLDSKFATKSADAERLLGVSRESLNGSARTSTDHAAQVIPVGRQNLRRHVTRDAARHVVLVCTDLAVIFAVQLAHNAAVQAGGAGPLRVFASDQQFGDWRLLFAVVLGMAIGGNYGAGDDRRNLGRMLLGGALALLLPAWDRIWSAPIPATREVGYALVVLVSALFAGRMLVDAIVRRQKNLTTARARTVLVGSGAECTAALGRSMFGYDNGFDIVGYVDVEATSGEAALGSLSDLPTLLQRHHVDTVVLCGSVTRTALAQVVRDATAAECALLAADQSFEIAGVRPAVIWRRGQPLIELRAEGVRGRGLALKRVFDAVTAGLLLLISAPLMAALTIAVRLDSRGPAIFGQWRVGRHGRHFRCYKFRSMCIDAEEMLRRDPQLFALYLANDYKLPIGLDPRVTRVGRLLRKTSLDELPQLWNVLRGDMSLVGPRPVLREELSHYGPEEPLLLSLRPGITGLWQVNGRSDVSYPARKYLELEYVQNWSLAHDISILVRTVPAVLQARGAP